MKNSCLSFLFIVFSVGNCFSQLRQNNALDAKNVYNYYLYHSNRSSEEEPSEKVVGDPYFTPLIDGYRYNAYRDVFVNAQNDIFDTDSLVIGDYTFVKESYYLKWSKKIRRGYLIKLDSTKYLQVRKKINEGYNPKNLNQSQSKFELDIRYFEKSQGKIKQVNRSKQLPTRFFLKLGFNHSQLSNYADGELTNRNSFYAAVGQRTDWKKNWGFKSVLFFAKNGGYNYYRLPDETGKRIIIYNTLGIDLLLEKEYKKWDFFTGVRSTIALTREQRLARRRRIKAANKRFRDIYSPLDDELLKIAPFSLPLGVGYEFIQDVSFEVQLNIGLLPIHQSTSPYQPIYLNSLQLGLLYQL